jgi:hypothetical protein
MTKIKDWRLNNLFVESVTDFENYLSGFLINAIPSFTVCDQSLTYSLSTKEFDVELTMDNQVILAEMMVEKWLEKEIQDVNQMNLHLQDRDFKVYSESQNLREKSFHLDKVKEYNSQRMTNYSFNNVDWNWLSGITTNS